MQDLTTISAACKIGIVGAEVLSKVSKEYLVLSLHIDEKQESKTRLASIMRTVSDKAGGGETHTSVTTMDAVDVCN